MTMKAKIGFPSGSLTGMQLPITVWDDAFVAVNETAAVATAEAARPASLFGDLAPTGSVDVEQQSRSAYRVTFTYEPEEEDQPEQPPAPETGSLVRRASCSTKSKNLVRYLEPVGVYNNSGDQSAYYPDQKWSPKNPGPEIGSVESGEVTVDPLQETRTLDYYIPNASLTEEYFAGIEELVEQGGFNDAEFFGYPIATMQLVRVSLQERSPDDWELSLGFGRRAVQTNVSVSDTITIPTLRACDHWYVVERPILSSGGDVIVAKIKLAVVGQAWPLMDFSVLALPGQNP